MFIHEICLIASLLTCYLGISLHLQKRYENSTEFPHTLPFPSLVLTSYATTAQSRKPGHWHCSLTLLYKSYWNTTNSPANFSFSFFLYFIILVLLKSQPRYRRPFKLGLSVVFPWLKLCIFDKCTTKTIVCASHCIILEGIRCLHVYLQVILLGERSICQIFPQ